MPRSRATARSERLPTPCVARWSRATSRISVRIWARARARTPSARPVVVDMAAVKHICEISALFCDQCSCLRGLRGCSLIAQKITDHTGVSHEHPPRRRSRSDRHPHRPADSPRPVSRSASSPAPAPGQITPAIERVTADASDAPRMRDLAAGRGGGLQLRQPRLHPLGHGLAADRRRPARRRGVLRSGVGDGRQPLRVRPGHRTDHGPDTPGAVRPQGRGAGPDVVGRPRGPSGRTGEGRRGAGERLRRRGRQLAPRAQRTRGSRGPDGVGPRRRRRAAQLDDHARHRPAARRGRGRRAGPRPGLARAQRPTAQPARGAAGHRRRRRGRRHRGCGSSVHEPCAPSGLFSPMVRELAGTAYQFTHRSSSTTRHVAPRRAGSPRSGRRPWPGWCGDARTATAEAR